jgi:hypothetical protein
VGNQDPCLSKHSQEAKQTPACMLLGEPASKPQQVLATSDCCSCCWGCMTYFVPWYTSLTNMQADTADMSSLTAPAAGTALTLLTAAAWSEALRFTGLRTAGAASAARIGAPAPGAAIAVAEGGLANNVGADLNTQRACYDHEVYTHIMCDDILIIVCHMQRICAEPAPATADGRAGATGCINWLPCAGDYSTVYVGMTVTGSCRTAWDLTPPDRQ